MRRVPLPRANFEAVRFWQCFDALPTNIQVLARKNYEVLKADPLHPSLHFKRMAKGRLHSVRVGLNYRAPGLDVDGGIHWFWIGTHAEYDKLVS